LEVDEQFSFGGEFVKASDVVVAELVWVKVVELETELVRVAVAKYPTPAEAMTIRMIRTTTIAVRPIAYIIDIVT